METGHLQSETVNGIGTVTFFHPQSNSLPGDLLRGLAAEITRMGKDPLVKVIVMKSAGEKAFCAGASFDDLVSIKDVETGTRFFSGFAEVINAIRLAPKFVIARIQGKVVGGGLGLSGAADYAFAVEAASVKLSELALGIGPFVVGPAVERKVGTAAFSQLSLNCTVWQSAQWAREKGLFAEVYKTVEEMDRQVEVLANNLAKSSPEAMQRLKTVLWEGTEHWDSLLAERAAISGKLVLSDFTREAIERFKAAAKG